MSAFWTYTMGVYGRDGVQPSVIHLQDARDADVNLLLYAMWTANLGLPAFDSTHVAFLASRVRAWREAAIEPLRAVRTGMRDGVVHVPEDEAEGLRKQILKLEIEAERIEQLIIESANSEAKGKESGEPDPSVVAENLAAVMALSDGENDEADLASMRALVEAACQEAGSTAVDAAMSLIS
ncbi:MAG: TIGR02444 family protein [Rhodospirillales bacterium]|nr:TIGR02444 family protein [Rhodospirillales bacterium]